MLWRVRTTLPDRPGSLAALAQECGAASVNIVALQVFPDRERVTDELVLSCPDDWDLDQVATLLARAGGQDVVGQPCDDAALADQSTRYVEAARAVLAQPASFPEVVARLFDADVRPGQHDEDVLEMAVGDVGVQLRRAVPFTGIERARGAAMAQLVSDVLERGRSEPGPSNGLRPRGSATPDYVAGGSEITALVDGAVVGRATVHPPGDDEPEARRIDIDVDLAWQRRGIGTRLLIDAARLARALGADEIVLTTEHDNRAVMPMVLAAGMRGRIRMAGEALTVRIVVRELKPLTPASLSPGRGPGSSPR